MNNGTCELVEILNKTDDSLLLFFSSREFQDCIREFGPGEGFAKSLSLYDNFCKKHGYIVDIYNDYATWYGRISGMREDISAEHE